MQNPGPGRILLIEDEPTALEISQVILEGAGYTVDTAESSAAARERLNTSRYTLVIADWILPDGDGILLADHAVRLGAATMVVTGHISDLPPGTGTRHHLLTKPINPAHLLAVVKATIGEAD